DETPAHGSRCEVAVADRRDRDDRPPDAVPVALEVLRVELCLRDAGDEHEKERQQGDASERLCGRQTPLRLKGPSDDRTSSKEPHEAPEPDEPNRREELIEERERENDESDIEPVGSQSGPPPLRDSKDRCQLAREESPDHPVGDNGAVLPS